GEALVYLDANVLVAGIVRTLVLICSQRSNYRAVWSPYAEHEAERHQPTRAKRIADIQMQYDLPIVPDGRAPVPLIDTDPKDIPILGSAAAAGSRFVITENVKDFGVHDLERVWEGVMWPSLAAARGVAQGLVPGGEP